MEKLLIEVIDKLDGGIIIVDADLRICVWNRWLERESGVNAALAKGRNLEELCSNLAEPQLRKILQFAVKDGQSFFLSGRIHGALCAVNERFAGRRHDIRVEPLRLKEVTYVLLQITDRSEWLAQNEFYENKMQQLEERCRELENFAALKQGFFDPLTGLFSRALLQERMKYVLAQAERGEHKLALIFFGLGGLQEISDACGGPAVEEALCEAARRLKCCVRSSDTLARWTEKEFILILSHIKRSEDAAVVAENILRAFKPAWQSGKQHFRLTASMGISIFPSDGRKPDELVAKAEAAFHKAQANYEFSED